MKIIAESDKWHESHTDLSKYLVTRLYQLVDVYEVISYRYPITNAMILLEELYETATLCLERPKTLERLKSLLDECIDDDIQTSIVNDLLIDKYFRQIKNDFKGLKEKHKEKEIDLSKETNVKIIQLKSLIALSTLQEKYISLLRSELNKIDFPCSNFDKESNKIDKLLRILVSHALHSGHSIVQLKISFKRLIEDNIDYLIDQLFKIFSFDNERRYQCFINFEELDKKLQEQLKANHITEDSSKFRSNVSCSLNGYIFQASGKDPFSALRNTVTTAFRQLSIKFPGIDSSILKGVWDNSYSFNEGIQKYSKLNLIQDGDPIIPMARVNTLKESLDPYKKLELFNEKILERFEDSLYLYHLALGVPTIENSYILLWTALESLMGLRTNEADIITIKKNVTKALALGAVGRRVNATVQRMRTTSNANLWTKAYYPKNDSNAKESDSNGLCHWIEWIADQNIKGTNDDPYNDMKREPLLGKQYCTINQTWVNLKQLHDIIIKSQKNLDYQLDRLYQTRNRIVHSGRFGRTGMYLWIHLEWYVAKLLAVAILITDNLPNQLDAEPRDIVFGCLRGQYESSINYLDRHKEKKIEFDYILESGITRFPVLCF